MSSLLSADDLNDFISPGAACIKPVETLPPSGSENPESGEVEIQIDGSGNPLEISAIDGKAAALSPAQISLADCLACSGCITSAEEVLVAQHSHEQLLKALSAGDKVFVVSISHQSRASLAHAFNVLIPVMDSVLIEYFKNKMGFRYVVGTALGRKLSLLQETQRMLRLKGVISSPDFVGDQKPQLPVLSSVCPGWVLYAEKTHPYTLPRMSPVKLAQQVTGLLLKLVVASDLGISRDQIYHLSIMPCFDKKLESARPESAGDVDCVLTPKELLNLSETSSYKLSVTDTSATSAYTKDSLLQGSSLYTSAAPPSWPFKELLWLNDLGSGSGGYAHAYLTAMHDVLSQANPEKEYTVVTIEGKNTDIYEMRLMEGTSQKASVAVVNGFRNIQNLVRRLKPSQPTKANPLAARRRARVGARTAAALEETADASKCDYVEIMACPGGCINGGGQISAPDALSEKQWLADVRDVYMTIDALDVTGTTDNMELASELLAWTKNFEQEYSITPERIFNTTFNEVEKPTDPATILLGSKW